jgi:hypothetical protein
MPDLIHKALSVVYESLVRSAKKNGVDPANRHKSEFEDDEEAKQTFIDAWGQEAYDNLKD